MKQLILLLVLIALPGAVMETTVFFLITLAGADGDGGEPV